MVFRKVACGMGKLNTLKSPFFFINGQFGNGVHPQIFPFCISPQYPERNFPLPSYAEGGFIILCLDIVELERIVKEEVAKDEVSVIITKSPCVLLKGNKFTTKCVPVPEKCVKCGMCLRPGCPALTKNADGTISIDQTMCNGCGLCKNLCKLGAIETVEV